MSKTPHHNHAHKLSALDEIDPTFPEIPEFLKFTPEERREAWADFDRRKQDDPSITVTRPGTGRPAGRAACVAGFGASPYSGHQQGLSGRFLVGFIPA
jgi:hypothetical protein